LVWLVNNVDAGFCLVLSLFSFGFLNSVALYLLGILGECFVCLVCFVFAWFDACLCCFCFVVVLVCIWLFYLVLGWWLLCYVSILHWFGFWFVFDCGFLDYIIVLIICLVIMSYVWWVFGCVYWCLFAFFGLLLLYTCLGCVCGLLRVGLFCYWTWA